MHRFSDVFKALSNETRLKILRILANRERSVGSIVRKFNLSQPTISHHLKILSQMGLVTKERSRQLVKYKLNREMLLGLGDRILKAFNLESALGQEEP